MGLFDGRMTEFEDFTLMTNDMVCRIKFSKFTPRFKQAQEWLEKTVMEKMTPVMPKRTGALIRKTVEENNRTLGNGRVPTIGLPYGKRLYSGINPKSGQPWHWTNPNTQPWWGEYTINAYKPEIVEGVRRIILKGAAR